MTVTAVISMILMMCVLGFDLHARRLTLIVSVDLYYSIIIVRSNIVGESQIIGTSILYTLDP